MTDTIDKIDAVIARAIADSRTHPVETIREYLDGAGFDIVPKPSAPEASAVPVEAGPEDAAYEPLNEDGA